MSGSLRRCRIRCEEDISGQFRVTVPDTEELDQLRTRGGVYRRGLYTAGNRGNAPPEKTQSLPASSCESSTEPMDMDDARRASEEIYRRIRQQAGLSRSGSVGDITLQPAPLGIMTQGKLVLQRGMPEQSQAGQSSVESLETTAGAVGGVTLLNIPPCSMAEGPGEQSQILFRPPMSDPEVDLERRRGARPEVAESQTTQTKKEEAKAASTEERVLQVWGTDFYLPLGGQPRISERKSWRAPIVTEQGNPGIYVQIDEWLPLYKGNIYVVDEVTGRMYLAKGEHLMQIAETASHHPFQDHELSMSRHIPEWEYFGQGGQELPLGPRPKIAREGRGDLDPPTPTVGVVGEIGRTPIPVAESTRHPGEKLQPLLENMREKNLTKQVSLQLLHKAREGPLERLGVTMKEENLSGHCSSPQIHADLQRLRQGERRQPLGAPRDRMGVPLNIGTLPLDINCWKLTRDVEGGKLLWLEIIL